jgi:hypothetical protein
MTAEEVRPAAAELAALAAASRGWDAVQVRGILAAAAQAGMTWPRALAEMTRIILDPAAQPGDLHRTAIARGRGIPAERNAALAAAARTLLNERIHGEGTNT